MEIIAIAKSVRMAPRKVRLVADSVKHLSLDDAMGALITMEKRAATPVAKLLKSAVANAVNNAKLEKNNLEIASINVTDGQALKRFRPSTRGRIHPYKRRSTNIRIVLKERGDKK
jgi:large subunit ribosomal protein L22